MLQILTKINFLLSPSLGFQMNPSNRFKRVASKPNKSIPSSQSSNELERRRSQRSKSMTKTKPTQKQTHPPQPNPNPNPKLEIEPSPVSDPSFPKTSILSPDFFQIDALDLAPRLLGKFLRRDDVVLQITEVNSVHFLLVPPPPPPKKKVCFWRK